ncbi:MAG TPA: LytTR family DNA-binding domain-containing protein [Chitinophagaceae bacterium]
MKCVIIDDERPAIAVIKRYIERLPNLDLGGTAINPITGIEIVKKEKPDVVFLDIQMDQMSGIDVMKIISEYSEVVFCTAYSEFAVQSYELDAVDYLMKPIEFPRFALAVQRVNDVLLSRHTAYQPIPNDYIFIKTGQRGKMLRIDLDDIAFIEGMSNYVAFHLTTKKVVAYLSLKELEEKLPESQFMRIHKSYIVSLRQVSSLENNELILKKDSKHLPLGAIFKDTFLGRMKDKLIQLIIGVGFIEGIEAFNL